MTPTDPLTRRRYESLLADLTSATPAAAKPLDRRGVYEPLIAYDRHHNHQPAEVGPLAKEVMKTALPPGDLPASEGGQIARHAWCALAGWSAGIEPEPMAGFFAMLVSRQQADGQFLRASPSDNPEPHWYHELIILHAVASFGCRARLPQIRQVAGRAAMFHLHETQPDHATTEPWAVHAFAAHLDTLPLADALLHAVQTHHGGQPDYISWMLLRDALYCLQQTPEPHQS